MISKKQQSNFSQYRIVFNDDIVLWQWLFSNGHFEEAAEVLWPMLKNLIKFKQFEFLGRYAQNLSATFSALGREGLAMKFAAIAYQADILQHGKKAAKNMPGYETFSKYKGWRLSLWKDALKTSVGTIDDVFSDIQKVL